MKPVGKLQSADSRLQAVFQPAIANLQSAISSYHSLFVPTSCPGYSFIRAGYSDCTDRSGRGISKIGNSGFFTIGPRFVVPHARYTMKWPHRGARSGKEREDALPLAFGHLAFVVRLSEYCRTISRQISPARGRSHVDHPGAGKPRPSPLRLARQISQSRTPGRLDPASGAIESLVHNFSSRIPSKKLGPFIPEPI